MTENILDCFTDVYKNSLGVIGLQGGYYERDGEKLFTELGFVSYYYNKGEVDFPSNEDVLRELGTIVDDSIGECLNSSDYSGVDFSFDSYTTQVRLEDDNVKFITFVVLDVNEGGSVRRIDLGERSVIIESSLYYMIVIGQFSANYALENDEKICLSCIEQLGKISDLSVEIIDMETDNNDFLFLVYTKNENEYPKVFEFMHSNIGEGGGQSSRV